MEELRELIQHGDFGELNVDSEMITAKLRGTDVLYKQAPLLLPTGKDKSAPALVFRGAVASVVTFNGSPPPNDPRHFFIVLEQPV
jgi:hypothetical protein